MRLSRGNELCQLNQSICRTNSIHLFDIPSHSASSSNISARDDSAAPAAKMQAGRLEKLLGNTRPSAGLEHLDLEPSLDALSQPCWPCMTASLLTLRSTSQALSDQPNFVESNADTTSMAETDQLAHLRCSDAARVCQSLWLDLASKPGKLCSLRPWPLGVSGRNLEDRGAAAGGQMQVQFGPCVGAGGPGRGT